MATSARSSKPKFFSNRTGASATKADIVVTYFVRWARILAKKGRPIQYADLFSGPGVYEGGEESTPIRIVRAALAEPWASQLHCTFNDLNPEYTSQLRGRVEAIPGVDRLREISFSSEPVNATIADQFANTRLPPTFTFIDPFGYTGLTNRLIQGALKDPGCEVVFFFNYPRVNAGISNPIWGIAKHIEGLFDIEDAKLLNEKLKGLSPARRDGRVMELLDETLRERGKAKYVLPFTFYNGPGTRVSHRIVFATKRPEGAMLMKEVMASASGGARLSGIPLYAYGCPVEKPNLLNVYADPVGELANSLATNLSGQQMTVKEVYLQHVLELTPFVQRHCKDALLRLEDEDRVICDVPRAKRPRYQGRPTFGDDRVVRFR